MKQCPRCASEISANDKVCPRCGLDVKKMMDFASAQGMGSEEFSADENLKSNQTQKKKLSKDEKKQKKRERKLAKKQAKREKRERESKSDTDFSKYATNAEHKENFSDEDALSFRERNKIRKNKNINPQFELDENGEFNINTDDVELVGEEAGKILDEKYRQSYSVKKSRGDYRPPKIKWWEIYKLADRSFARRKIKKEVNKAAIKKPDFIKKSKLLLLAIFLGWTGAHNFYAKNKKKGWVSVISLILWIGVAILSEYSTFFASIVISVSGCAGFINLFIWVTDIFAIIFNRFKYRIQKEGFIFGMNVETRAKLGEKYIDLELYQKPWWVRFKAWRDRKKRDWQEYRRESKQAKIDRQKKKLEKEEELERQDEIQEDEKLKTKQSSSKKKAIDKSKILDSQTLREISSFDGGVTMSQNEGLAETDKNTSNGNSVSSKKTSKNSQKAENTETTGESKSEEKQFVDNKAKSKKSFKSKKK